MFLENILGARGRTRGINVKMRLLRSECSTTLSRGLGELGLGSPHVSLSRIITGSSTVVKVSVTTHRTPSSGKITAKHE